MHTRVPRGRRRRESAAVERIVRPHQHGPEGPECGGVAGLRAADRQHVEWITVRDSFGSDLSSEPPANITYAS